VQEGLEGKREGGEGSSEIGYWSQNPQFRGWIVNLSESFEIGAYRSRLSGNQREHRPVDHPIMHPLQRIPSASLYAPFARRYRIATARRRSALMDEPRDDKSADSGARWITRRVPSIAGSSGESSRDCLRLRFTFVSSRRDAVLRSLDSVQRTSARRRWGCLSVIAKNLRAQSNRYRRTLLTFDVYIARANQRSGV